MRDDLGQQSELARPQEELSGAGYSRRNFLHLFVKGVAVGFGAAAVLGASDADALAAGDPGASSGSTDPTTKAEGKETALVEDREGPLAEAAGTDADDPLAHMAYRRRWWRRRWRWRRRRYWRVMRIYRRRRWWWRRRWRRRRRIFIIR